MQKLFLVCVVSATFVFLSCRNEQKTLMSACDCKQADKDIEKRKTEANGDQAKIKTIVEDQKKNIESCKHYKDTDKAECK